MMVILKNLVPHLTVHYRILQSYFDNDGHWDQFGTTVDHAVEVQSDFHNDGQCHWNHFSTHTWPELRIAKLSW